MAKPVGLPEFLVASLTLAVLLVFGLAGDALGPVSGACSLPGCEGPPAMVDAFYVTDADAPPAQPVLVIPAGEPAPQAPDK